VTHKNSSGLRQKVGGLVRRFDRDLLPTPEDYYRHEGVTLRGRGEWQSAQCVFHNGQSFNLRINVVSGAFKCMKCGQSGGDVLAFHRLRYGLSFANAARNLGCWREAGHDH
jgi:hypothetical protein